MTKEYNQSRETDNIRADIAGITDEALSALANVAADARVVKKISSVYGWDCMDTTSLVERRISEVSCTDLARELDLGKSHVSLILNGKRLPSLPVAAGLAKALGVSLDDLHGYLVRRVWVN